MIIVLSGLSLYTIIAFVIGLTLLRMFIQDSTASMTDKACWIVLIGTALFWLIVLPISARERMAKQSLNYSHNPQNLRKDRISDQQPCQLETPKA